MNFNRKIYNIALANEFMRFPHCISGGIKHGARKVVPFNLYNRIMKNLYTYAFLTG